MNEIVADSGYAPEWIMLRKDILSSRSELRDLIRRRSNRRQNENRERLLPEDSFIQLFNWLNSNIGTLFNIGGLSV